MAKRSKRKREGIAGAVSRTRVTVSGVTPVSGTPSLISPIKKKPVLTTSQHTYHSRSSGEAARLSQHLQRVAAIPSSAEKRQRISKLSLAKAVAEPDVRKSSEKAREAPHCKKRPDSKKAARGSGGSKRYVPWCG